MEETCKKNAPAVYRELKKLLDVDVQVSYLNNFYRLGNKNKTAKS